MAFDPLVGLVAHTLHWFAFCEAANQDAPCELPMGFIHKESLLQNNHSDEIMQQKKWRLENKETLYFLSLKELAMKSNFVSSNRPQKLSGVLIKSAR